MVAGIRLTSDSAVHASSLKSVGGSRAQQQMVDPQTGVSWPMLSEIVPEGEDRLVGIERSDGINPALLLEALPAGPSLRLEQSVFPPRARSVDVKVGRHDVEVPRQNDRMGAINERRGVSDEPLEPTQLVFELRTGLRIAVWQIQGADDQAAHCCLKIAPVVVCGITGEDIQNRDDLHLPSENGDSIPGPLTLRDALVSGSGAGQRRKCRVRRLEFLKASNVRPLAL